MCVCDLCIVFHHASYHRLYPRIQLRGEGGLHWRATPSSPARRDMDSFCPSPCPCAGPSPCSLDAPVVLLSFKGEPCRVMGEG